MLILKSTLALLFTAAIAVHAAPGNTAPLGDVGVEVSPDGLDVDVSVDGADVDLSIDDEGIELNGSVELAARRTSAWCNYDRNDNCDTSSVNAADCERARHKIEPGKRYVFSDDFAQQWKGGVCHGSCRLMVGGRKRNGAPCDMAGLKMINAYYELKNKGCSSCGTKRFKDGCELRMAYEWNCNRW